MIFALRLGDVQTGEGPATIYLGLTETVILPPAIAQSDEDGLRQLLDHARGTEMVCDRALGRAAKVLALRTATPPDWTLIPCAELATVFHLGHAIERPALAAVVPAIAAARAFVSAAPWQYFGNSDAIDFFVDSGARPPRSYEGCVMGAGGQEFGVALYDEPGSLGRMAALFDADRLQDAHRIDALGLTIDDHPAWVSAAVERAFGVPVVLSPMRVHRGAVRPVTAHDLMLLAAATGAAAKLDPERLEVQATVGQDEQGVTVVARVRSGAVPVSRPSKPRSPGTTRPRSARVARARPRGRR